MIRNRRPAERGHTLDPLVPFEPHGTQRSAAVIQPARSGGRQRIRERSGLKVARASGACLALALSLTSAAGAQPAVPAATPAATALPYPTIGRTRSKRYCTLETARANGAITVALTNDRIISAGIARLRRANLDRPQITIIEREKSLRDLRGIASAIQTNLRAGDAQIDDLRKLSVKEPDATRSPELKALADQLDEAFDRQRSIGSDLAKMLVIVDGRYAAAQGTSEAASLMPEPQEDKARNGLPSIDQRAAHEPFNALFADVADEFGGRVVEIGKSEDAAAVHAPKAISGC
jgi:hypothetical protein